VQTIQTRQEVANLAQTWIDAERRGDTTFLDQTLADDFVGVGPLGFMLNKSQWIGRHESGDLTYDALSLDEVTVRVYGMAAILIGRQAQRAAFRGNSIAAELRVTVVLVQREGDWQVAGVHLSPIGQPPSFASQRSSEGTGE
jgi:hypothetical protein